MCIAIGWKRKNKHMIYLISLTKLHWNDSSRTKKKKTIETGVPDTTDYKVGEITRLAELYIMQSDGFSPGG